MTELLTITQADCALAFKKLANDDNDTLEDSDAEAAGRMFWYALLAVAKTEPKPQDVQNQC